MLKQLVDSASTLFKLDFQCWRNNISKLYDFEDTLYLRISIYLSTYIWASQVALVVKNPPAKARAIRDTSSIPASGRSPGGGHGDPLCLENPMDKGAWYGLQSIGSQRVRHDWSDLASKHTCVCVCVCVCVCIWCFSLEWAPLVAQTVRNPPAIQETWVRSLDPKDPLEKGMTTHSSILS